jgi:hypothetical protein
LKKRQGQLAAGDGISQSVHSDQAARSFLSGAAQEHVFPPRRLWVVPVILTYPRVGIVGNVGMVAVDAEQETVVGWTPFPEMGELAKQLYQEKKHEIEIAFS